MFLKSLVGLGVKNQPLLAVRKNERHHLAQLSLTKKGNILKLSAAQRDRVLLETSKEEDVMRREMLQAFTESSKRSESAMNEIANSMNNF